MLQAAHTIDDTTIRTITTEQQRYRKSINLSGQGTENVYENQSEVFSFKQTFS